jgi:hypothetical protein
MEIEWKPGVREGAGGVRGKGKRERVGLRARVRTWLVVAGPAPVPGALTSAKPLLLSVYSINIY